jgi:hypothetical protein
VSSIFAQVWLGHKTNKEGSHSSNYTSLLVNTMDIDQKSNNVYNINDNLPEMRDLKAKRISFSS